MTSTPRLPLMSAALVLLADGSTSGDLEDRFAVTGARLEPGAADELLDELLALGLGRVGRVVDGRRFVVPTSLGLKLRGGTLPEEAGTALADLETLRSDLLSTIAHELRTPLTVIRTSAGLLADPASPPSDGQRETLVATIVRNADRMQRVVADILDLSRYRSGSIRLQMRRFDPCDLAHAVVSSVGPLADAHGQRITLEDCDDRAGREVYGDRRRLEQALVNLVSNAQRFSPDGAEIVVAVEHGTATVRWTVTDRGPGIPDADRGRLFERFFVGRNDRTGSAEGVGLGLPTALAIAQAHGGTIEVDSEVGRGSTFRLVVPVDGPGGDEP